MIGIYQHFSAQMIINHFDWVFFSFYCFRDIPFKLTFCCVINLEYPISQIEGYRMLPSNLKVLTKFGPCSNCSQKLDECSHARIFVKIPCRVAYTVCIICILKTKTDTGNNVSCMWNWETLGTHARTMNSSGKMLPHFVDVYWNWPGWVHSQVAG